MWLTVHIKLLNSELLQRVGDHALVIKCMLCMQKIPASDPGISSCKDLAFVWTLFWKAPSSLKNPTELDGIVEVVAQHKASLNSYNPIKKVTGNTTFGYCHLCFQKAWEKQQLRPARAQCLLARTPTIVKGSFFTCSITSLSSISARATLTCPWFMWKIAASVAQLLINMM